MTGTPIGKPREYHMAFNIENGGKAITGVKVTLARFIEKDMNARFNINIMEDPLFPAVFQNIMNNARHNADLAELLSASRAAAARLNEYISTSEERRLAGRLHAALAKLDAKRGTEGGA